MRADCFDHGEIRFDHRAERFERLRIEKHCVLRDGRKIGSMHTTRKLDGARVVTMQEMRIELDRAGLKVGLSTSEVDEETRAGAPLRFESRTKVSGIESVQTGSVRADGKID